MITPSQTNRPQILGRQLQEHFLEMLPQIRSQACRAFRRLQREQREEMVQEVVANAFCRFVSLVHQGKANRAFGTPLANFAIRQAIAGRRVGSKSRSLDVSSPLARAARGFLVERLDGVQGEWRAALVEDRRASPADTAAARIDVAAWFRALSESQRRIASALAMGETTSEVARLFGLSAARVSQIRCLLHASWQTFQGGEERRRSAS